MTTLNGPVQPVIVITDSDLVENGGTYRLANGPALPVEGIPAGGGGRPIRRGDRIVVYEVAAPDIHVTRRLTLGSSVPMMVSTEGPERRGTAIPVFVTDGSL